MSVKVAIVDDHPIFREGFKMVLKSVDIVERVEEFPDGDTFLKNLVDKDIDLVFMDINMPGKDGVKTTEKALLENKKIRIIALTSFENIEYIDKMLMAGVEGYMLKDASYNEIEKAINRVMAGDNYFSEKILMRLSKRAVVKRDQERRKTDLPDISPRELEVLQLICEGKNRGEIAGQLFISERTVDKHKENLQTKTQAKNTVSLVLYAIKNRLVQFNLS